MTDFKKEKQKCLRRFHSRAVILALGIFLTATSAIFAQNVTVKGKITDDSTKEGIPGVNVVIKGTTTGVISNFDGEYTISAPSNATLTFSFIGYAPMEFPVNGRNQIDVSLKIESIGLEEVVAVGYGTMQKKNLTGAVSSVTSKTLERIPVANAAEALKGKLAGVQITTVDGSPDADIVIRVRGGGSVTQDNSPLFIVDGFPVGSINDIAPSDIESINVLKDASSAAIYGARGANGVILITTKGAQGGKTKVSYNGYYQFKQLPKKLDVLSPYEFVLANYEFSKLRDPNGTSDLKNFTTYFGVYDDLELYKSQRGTDWQDELFGRSTTSQTHNISISGGTEKTKLNLSFSNNKDEGMLVNNGYERSNINFKLNHEISKRLSVESNFRYSNTNVDGAGTSGSSSLRVSDGITTRPVNGLADFITIDPNSADTNYEDFLRSLINPVQLAQQDWRNRLEKRFTMQGAVKWEIIDGLMFRSEYGIDYNIKNNRRYYGPLTSTARNEGGNLPLGQIDKSTGQTSRLANTLTYNFKLGNLNEFTVLAGQELLNSDGESQTIRAKYFAESLEPEKLFANMALGTYDRMSTSLNTPDKMSSFFGRVHYGYAGKYLVQVTVRADGSSKFAPGNQWGVFPAASAAWRVSEEPFMQNQNIFTNLKLRFSYGEAGNNRIASDLWRRSYQISDNRTYGMNDVHNPYYVAASSTLVNPELKWETTITRNMGLDFNVFHDRLSGSIDVYNNSTKDLLVESDIPSYLGYNKQMRNIGETQNKGVELELNAYIIQKKDFTLTASFNIGFNTPTIKYLDGVNEKNFNSGWAGTDLREQDDYRVIVGQTVGLMYGYVTDGFYTVDDFSSYNETTGKYVLKDGVVDDLGVLKGGIGMRPGLMKLKDINGIDENGKLTGQPDGVINAYDRKIIGNANPKHTGGLNLTATYKGFDCSAYFNWVYGNDIYNTGKISFNMFHRTTYGNMLNTVNSDNRFKYIDFDGQFGEAGAIITDLDQLRQLNANATIWSPFSSGNASPVFSDWAVEDGSFLRLSNLTFGYSLPQQLIRKIGMSQLRVYGTIYNAWLWTKYSGYDPEVSTTRSSSYSALTPGVDYSAYPKSRSFTFGVNVTF